MRVPSVTVTETRRALGKTAVLVTRIEWQHAGRPPGRWSGAS